MLVSKLDGKNGAVLDRIVQAYGFKQKSQYADQVGLSSSNLAMRYKRDAFPADLVVQCLLDTDATLDWLINGMGEAPSSLNLKNSHTESLVTNTGEIVNLKRLYIEKGELKDNGELVFDSRFLINVSHQNCQLAVVQAEKTQYIIDRHYNSVADGRWLIDIDGAVSIRNLSRLPAGRVKVTGGETSFECSVSDITVLGAVVMVCE